MGTVVFPAARLKIYLTASAEERAMRRHKQLKEKGIDVSLADLSREIAERDRARFAAARWRLYARPTDARGHRLDGSDLEEVVDAHPASSGSDACGSLTA